MIHSEDCLLCRGAVKEEGKKELFADKIKNGRDEYRETVQKCARLVDHAVCACLCVVLVRKMQSKFCFAKYLHNNSAGVRVFT